MEEIKSVRPTRSTLWATVIADGWNGGYRLYVSASEIVNCAGGWMGQPPSSYSHAYRPLSPSSDAIASYHLLRLPRLRHRRAPPAHPMIWQVGPPPSLCCVST